MADTKNRDNAEYVQLFLLVALFAAGLVVGILVSQHETERWKETAEQALTAAEEQQRIFLVVEEQRDRAIAILETAANSQLVCQPGWSPQPRQSK